MQLKLKIKVVTVHGTNAYSNRGPAPLILNLGAIWRRVVNITKLQSHHRANILR
jgi:hypothetical protein